jgi:hypothetical protein
MKEWLERAKTTLWLSASESILEWPLARSAREAVMTIGRGRAELTVRIPPELVYPLVADGMREIGKVTDEDPPKSLQGTTRFGLQRVRLRVGIAAHGSGASVTIEGLADDVWGVGARRGIKRLLTSSTLRDVEIG